MFELFKSSPADPGNPKLKQAADAVTRLEEARERAQHVHDVAQAAYQEAAMQATEATDGDDKALEAARQQAERAERYLIESDLALQGARKRHQNAIQADQRAAHARAWDAVREASQRRQKAADNVEKLIDRFATAVRELEASTVSLAETLPPGHPKQDFTQNALASDHTQNAIRLRMRKAGITWSHTGWFGDPALIPDVIQQLKDESSAIAGLRPEGI